MNTPMEKLLYLKASEQDRELIFACVADTLKAAVDFKLFTILGFEHSYRIVSRLYSSDPDNFVVGGHKLLGNTEWGREVLINGRTLIAQNKADLIRIFPDHDVLLKMGLGSAANIPVKSGGKTVAMLNMIHEEGFYSPEKIAPAVHIADLLAPLLSTDLEIEYSQCARE